MKKAIKTHSLYATTRVAKKKERKSDALRRSLIDTFIGLVGKNGFEETTLDDIAQQLGMRRNHIGYYFPSRKSLLANAVERVIGLGQQITIQQVMTAKTVEEAFDAWAGAAFDWLELFPHHGAIVLVFYSHCPFDETFAALNSNIFRLGVERMGGVLERFQFPVKDKNRVNVVLRNVQTFNVGVILQHLTSKDALSWKADKARAVDFARSQLNDLKLAKRRRV